MTNTEPAAEPGKTAPAVYSALASVMKAVTGVPKAGRGPKEQGGYAFRKLDDTVDALGAAFRDNWLMLQSEVLDSQHESYQITAMVKGKYDKEAQERTTTWSRTRVTMRYRLTSLEDGSYLIFEAVGQGLDNSDKSSNKAMSQALKYGLSQALMLGTGDTDPDGESPQVVGETEAQRTLRERREAEEAAKKSPVPQPEPAPAAAPAQAAAPPQPDPQQIEREATRALTEAAKAAVNAEKPKELSSKQVERLDEAVRAAKATTSRHQLNRIILAARSEGLLDAEVEGSSLATRLMAARGVLT